MAQITGHKIIKEPVQITVDNSAIWDLIRSTCMKYKPASSEDEAQVLAALDLVEELFFANCRE